MSRDHGWKGRLAGPFELACGQRGPLRRAPARSDAGNRRGLLRESLDIVGRTSRLTVGWQSCRWSPTARISLPA